MSAASPLLRDTPQRADWREALLNDYALAVLTLGGLVAALWLAPFAVYRALTANCVAAVPDAVLALAIGGAAWHAWRTRDTRWPGWVMAVAIVGGIWAIGVAAQFAALFWAYPGVLMNFFSCLRRRPPSWARPRCSVPRRCPGRSWAAQRGCRFSSSPMCSPGSSGICCRSRPTGASSAGRP